MSAKLKKPKFTGMKIYCTTCCRDNPSCKHFDKQVYRMRLHVKGGNKAVRTKTLKSRDYDEAVDEAISFKKEMVAANYQPAYKPRGKVSPSLPVHHTLLSSVLKYDNYLSGKHELTHLRKSVSEAHRKENIRYCVYFCDVVKKTDNLKKLPIYNVSQQHVAAFYSWAEKAYAPRTFNKMMAAMKAFFDFIISVERVKMDNPFSVYVTKTVSRGQIKTLTKDEFKSILEAVDTANPWNILPNGRKRMDWPYIKEAFQLFLLTGGRREEVVDLKWSDLMINVNNTRFFQVVNGKVEKQMKAKNQSGEVRLKYFPVNADLFQLLQTLGYETYKGQDRYILEPDRTVTTKTIMNRISKSFTHYRKAAGIEKEVSLDELRKTYLTWLNAVMNKETKILSSHSTDSVLQEHYLDPTIISAVEKAALEFKVFGT